MRSGILGVSAILLACASLAFAGAAKPARPDRPDCGDARTQTDMNECFAAEAQRSQALLVRLLAELVATLDSPQKDQLVKVQKLWVTYRDAHCAWEASFFDGGSIQPTEHATCLNRLSYARIKVLAIQLCEGNGMTGECEASRRYTEAK